MLTGWSVSPIRVKHEVEITIISFYLLVVAAVVALLTSYPRKYDQVLEKVSVLALVLGKVLVLTVVFQPFFSSSYIHICKYKQKY